MDPMHRKVREFTYLILFLRVLTLISRNGKYVFSFPVISPQESFSSVLGQPLDICLLIGSLLSPKDLSRAQGVSKSWYCTFGRESLWKTHLPPLLASSLSHPPKLELVLHFLKRDCLEQGELRREEIKVSPRTYQNGACSPDNSWMIIGGGQHVYLMRHLESPSPPVELIGGKGTPLNLHQSEIVKGCMVGDHSSAFTFGERGYFVKWKGLKSNQITAILLAGNNTSFDPHHGTHIRGGSITKDGKHGLTYGWRGVYWRGLDTNSPTAIILSDQLGWNGCRLSPDGSWALMAGNRGLGIWKGLDTGNPYVIQHFQHSRLQGCVSSLDGSCAVTVDRFGKLIHWRDLESPSPSRKVIQLPQVNYPHLRFPPDGNWAYVLSTSGKTGILVIHRLNEVPKVTTIKAPIGLVDMCFSPTYCVGFLFCEQIVIRFRPRIECTLAER